MVCRILLFIGVCCTPKITSSLGIEVVLPAGWLFLQIGGPSQLLRLLMLWKLPYAPRQLPGLSNVVAVWSCNGPFVRISNMEPEK